MEPISLTGCHEENPGMYILPVRSQALTAAGAPRVTEYWQWFPATSATELGRWRLITAIGG